MGHEVLVVTELTRTSDSCPAQWEGWTDDGRQIYVRYRWGWLSVHVGQRNDRSELAAVNGRSIFSEAIGDSLDGSLQPSELITATKGIVEWPKSLLVETVSDQ